MRILQGLLLSLGIHLLLVWASQFLPSPEDFQTQTERIEFEVLDNTQARGQVVRQPVVPDQLLTDESEDPLRFMSERRQRVRKQMRAQASGKTENRSAVSGQQGQERQNRSRADVQDLFKLQPRDSGETGETARSARREQTLPSRRPGQNVPPAPNLMNLPQGFSTVGESMPNELEVGHFTSLNTDRYLFYSFFMRVEDLIRYNWESYVKDTINRTPRSAFLAQNRDTWISHVEIQLKPNGEFHRAYLLKSSGIEGFDWAAVDAFARAKLFPNPPQEMIEEDGLIHLKYSFAVQYRPTALGSAPRDRSVQ